jgi:hypothetical protein
VTQLKGIRRKLGLRFLENRIAHEPEKGQPHSANRRNFENAAPKHLIPVSEERTMLPSRSLSPCGKPATHSEKELTIPRKDVVCGLLSRFVRGHTGASARCEIIL